SRRRHTRSDRDWSSDVCSSDLTALPVLAVAAALAQPAISSGKAPPGAIPGIGPARPSVVQGPGYGTYAWPVQGPVIRGFEPPPEIGRASCRERVERSVVVGYVM